ncbi:unnamed protein product [Auanema sp. JU1783]|nr:unnamed protein product [Auanema sp. JU1783]
MSVDRLFDITNSYFLGNYQQCINEATKFQTKNEEEKVRKDVFMYLSYIEQGKGSIPLSELPQSTTNIAYKAVRRMAEFKNSNKRAKVVSEIENEISTGNFVADEINAVVSAAILNQSGNSEDALRALFKINDSLFAKSAVVSTLLRMDRIDQAIQYLKQMTEVDEDATITQLSLAWVNMAVGKDKLKEAFYIFQEMMDKYGQTVLLLVNQASVLIMQEKYEEAEKLLQEAQTRDPNNSEALINLIVVSQQLGKGDEVTNRYIAQLKDSHSENAFTKDLLAKEELFDRISSEA